MGETIQQQTNAMSLDVSKQEESLLDRVERLRMENAKLKQKVKCCAQMQQWRDLCDAGGTVHQPTNKKLNIVDILHPTEVDRVQGMIDQDILNKRTVRSIHNVLLLNVNNERQLEK